MSHELEILENGEAAYFGGRGKTAWHGLGTTIEGLATAQEALELAHLDWDVEKVPTYVGNSDGTYSQIPDAFANRRTSDGKVLGRVGGDYVVCQNRDAFAFVDSLIDSGEAVFDTAGSLFGGKRVFLSALLPDTIKIAGVDEHEMFVLFSNSHDGGTAITVSATPVRTVCRNTQIMALREAKQTWTVRHTSTLEGKLQEAREALQLTYKYAEAFQAAAEKLLDVQVEEEQFKAIIEGLFPKTQKLQFTKNVDGVMDNWKNSATITDDVRMTGWGAYNAVTEWISWERSYRTDEAKVKNVLGGSGAQLANSVAKALVSLG